MNKRRSSSFQRCPQCKLNQTLCYCHELPSLNILTKIYFLQHHREINLTSNTVNWARLMIQGTETYYRGVQGNPFKVESLDLQDQSTLPLYLFPEIDAVPLTAENLAMINPDNRPIKLIIPDGSWSQARKIFRREFQLNNSTEGRLKPIPVMVPKTMMADYVLRKSPGLGHLSTFEAMAHALLILEKNEALFLELKRHFDELVRRVLISRTSFSKEKLSERKLL